MTHAIGRAIGGVCLFALVLSCNDKKRTSEDEPPAPQASTHETPQPGAPHDDAALARDGGAPALVLDLPDDETWQLAQQGMPAVSSDGALMAIAYIDPDGERGHPNLELIIRDVDTNQTAQSWKVLGVEEFGRARGPKPLSLLRKKMQRAGAEANDFLAKRSWLAMTRQEAEYEGEAPQPPVHVGDIEVSYQDTRVIVKRAGAVVLDKSFPQWKLAVAEGDDDACSWDDYLAAVAIHPETRSLLVEVAYAEGHNCGPKPTAFQTLRLPQ